LVFLKLAAKCASPDAGRIRPNRRLAQWGWADRSRKSHETGQVDCDVFHAGRPVEVEAWKRLGGRNGYRLRRRCCINDKVQRAISLPLYFQSIVVIGESFDWQLQGVEGTNPGLQGNEKYGRT
jgi:hypothetical protein